MMTPREALETIRLGDFSDLVDMIEATEVLERLVSKDEADRKFVAAQQAAEAKAKGHR